MFNTIDGEAINNGLRGALAAALLAACLLFNACAAPTNDSARSIAGVDNAVLVLITEPDHAQLEMMSSFSSHYRWTDYPHALSVRHTLNQLASDYQLREIDGWSINALGVYCALLSLPADRPREQLIRQLQRDPRVESVQPLYYYSVLAQPQPQAAPLEHPGTSYNDPYFAVQYRDHGAQIQQLHRRATGRDVSVAVIDTGIDKEHPELAQRIAGWRNYVDADDAQFNTDIHGTAVSGIIAAAANNGEGIVGIAPDVDLWALKACWQLRADSGAALCNSFTVASALSFAIERQLDIINISLAGPRDPLVARLIAAAVADGRIIVAADPLLSERRYPALLPGVIAVRQPADPALPADRNDGNEPDKTAVIAPGTDILSTGPGGGYDFFSGSSLAAATVTGLTALLHQQNPRLSYRQRLQLLGNIAILNDSRRAANKALTLHSERLHSESPHDTSTDTDL